MRQTKLDRRGFLRAVGAAAAATATPRWLKAADDGAGQPAKAGVRPNFVIIFTDDQGYQDVGCFGSPDIRTPNLDRMAAEGTKFTSFYVAAPVCTPSRAALMTGCYPKRVGLERGVLFPNSRRGLNTDEITIAELLKKQGYATMCIGKWHLGHVPAFLPTRQGFDGYYGIPYSNDMPTKAPDGRRGAVLLRNEKVEEHPVDQSTLTGKCTAEAVKFIAANKDRPFFLYMPHSMPHVPLFASKRFKGTSKRGLYGDVIEEIDWSVGEVLKALKDNGVDERTLVVFTSDNGPWLSKRKHGGSALPLRAGKGTTYEGGMREPCIVRWPGKVPAGKVCSEMATTMDLLPTFAKLAGTAAPGDRVIDGKDVWPLMAGQAGAKTPHEAFFYHTSGGRLAAVRSGKWKLHIKPPPRPRKPKKGEPPKPKPKPRPPILDLYDLEADIGERKNVAAANPDVVARLKALADAFDKEITRNRRPVGKLKATKRA